MDGEYIEVIPNLSKQAKHQPVTRTFIYYYIILGVLILIIVFILIYLLLRRKPEEPQKINYPQPQQRYPPMPQQYQQHYPPMPQYQQFSQNPNYQQIPQNQQVPQSQQPAPPQQGSHEVIEIKTQPPSQKPAEPSKTDTLNFINEALNAAVEEKQEVTPKIEPIEEDTKTALHDQVMSS